MPGLRPPLPPLPPPPVPPPPVPPPPVPIASAATALKASAPAMRSPVRDTLIDERMIPPLFSSSAASVEQTVFVVRRLIDVGPRGNRCRACRKGRRLSHYGDSPERAAVAGKVFREMARG